jgi:iron complex outermembrane receptor protein
MKLFYKTFTRTLAFVLCIFAAQHTLEAQRTITGIVKDGETGEGLIGATVVEKETPGNGTSTDIDGRFRLTVSNNATALMVSYSSYEAKEYSIVGSDQVDIALDASSTLDEVVVIGYGTVKREDATGLVQTTSSEQFNRGAITGPQELIAGKVPGVVVTTDGSPGGGSQIRIRGESSLSANKDPLIVVDGVPLDNGGVSGSRNPLNIVNPNDIETFTVLKDAAATAIYGNRASAGVIIITTKKGKLGRKLQVGYNGNVSWGVASNKVDVLNADEYRKAINDLYFTEDPNDKPHPSFGLLGNANTDWQDEIYQTAFGTDHNINFSGGVGIIPYRVSLGYTFKEGLLKTDEFSRYSAAVNLSPGFIDNTLQVNFHFKGILNDNHFADRGAIGNALRFDPTQSVRADTTDRFGGYTTWTQAGNPNALAPTNPLALLNLRNDNSTVKQYITNVNVDYRLPFIKELHANLNLGYDYARGEGTITVPNFAAFAFDAINGGGVNNYYEQTKKNTLLETYLNYKNRWGIHGFDIMGGYSWQHFEVDNYFKNTDSAGTPAETTEGKDPAEYYLISLFGRVNYDLLDKYFFTFTLRRDGTSRFAPDNRWGLFPAAAVGVKLFDNDQQNFNYLKLRASWGITGQQDIGDYYAYLARYQFGQNNASYQFGDEFVQTVRPNGYIADIKWEETTTYNLGLDFSIVRDRVGGSIDVYQRNTDDLLNFIQLAALSNLTNEATRNVGSLRTQGVELALNFTPIRNGVIDWNFNTNFAYNKNEITKLTTSIDSNYIGVLTGGIAGGVGSNIQIHSVGYAPSSFYVKEQVYDENGRLLEGVFVDRNNDGLDNDLDKYRYKNPAPNFTIGFTNNLSIKRFTFSFAGRANLGQYVYNNVQTDMGYLNRLYSSTNYLSNINQSGVDLNVFDQANLTFSDYFVKKASFFRIDHFTLAYDLSHVFQKNVQVGIGNGDVSTNIGKRNGFISYFNVYATIQNPFVVTPYDGLDPEISNGIDNNIYPRPRTFLVGVNVNF